MSRASFLPIRQGLQEFFRHCERVLASVHAPDHAPFSQDELQMICYYANEVAKIADHRGCTAMENRQCDRITAPSADENGLARGLSPSELSLSTPVLLM